MGARLQTRMAAALLALAALGASGPLLAAGETAPAEEVPAAEPRPVPFADRELPEGWYATLETSLGAMLLRLHPEQAPQGVAHFAALAEGRLEWTDVVTGEVRSNRFYDGLHVHRALAGRMFEAGDPHGTGHGAPAIWVPPEVSAPINFNSGYRVGLMREPLGKISAAKFFVTASPEPLLNARTPCIGTVIEGREVVFQITSVRTYSNARPIDPVTIERLTIFKRGDPPPLQEPRPYTPVPRTLRLRDDARRPR